MARGYPDFFGFSVFPGPGAGVSNVGGVVAVAGGNTETLIELSLKGSVVGGQVYGDNLGPNGLYAIQVTLDGVLIDECFLGNMRLLYQYQDEGFLFALNYYNLEDNDWQARVAEQLSFGFQYKLALRNADVNLVNVTTNIYYYNVV